VRDLRYMLAVEVTGRTAKAFSTYRAASDKCPDGNGATWSRLAG
jgi:hypothetical protein